MLALLRSQIDVYLRSAILTSLLCDDNSSLRWSLGGDTPSQTSQISLAPAWRHQGAAVYTAESFSGVALDWGGPPGIHERAPTGQIVFHYMLSGKTYKAGSGPS